MAYRAKSLEEAVKAAWVHWSSHSDELLCVSEDLVDHTFVLMPAGRWSALVAVQEQGDLYPVVFFDRQRAHGLLLAIADAIYGTEVTSGDPT